MYRFLFLKRSGMVVLAFWMLTLASVSAAKPNILLIMADDMGYTDIGCYGSEIQTPHLDSLAEGGVRFTQFYNTSRCCPTRASLLTGLYSHQAGIGLMTGDRGFPAYRGDLNRRCLTLAEALRPSGYHNYLSGKWHVTKYTGPEGPKHNWPLQRGFDRFYGTIIGAGSFYDPATLCRGNNYITPENDPEFQLDDFHYTEAITENARGFLRDHLTEKGKEEPFFLYVSYTSAHWPMQAPENLIQKYKGKYDHGYSGIRKRRRQRAIDNGVLRPEWKMSAPAVDWAKVPHKEWERRCMEVYAAMVDQMDAGIGRILEDLKAAELYENTIVIYLQDNGGCAEGFGRADNSAQQDDFQFKPLGKDGLQTKIWPPMQTRDGRWVRTGPETMPGAEDTFVAYGKGWANVSNTPFRGFKHEGYEGGISTPFIFHWPAGLEETRSKAIVREPAHLIDIMPTLLDCAGGSYPDRFRGERIYAMEGVSLMPAIRGGDLDRNGPLAFEHHGNLALRMGRWKIVSTYQKDKPVDWELYDMKNDRTELNNLALENPEKRDELVRYWDAWASRVGVQSWPFEPRR